MVIMGVDPGSRVTGYGFIASEGSRLLPLDFGAVRVASSGRVPGIPERLNLIYQKFDSLLDRHHPEVVVVEGVFYAINVRSALTLGHVRGVVLLAAAQRGLPVQEYSPLEVKKAVAGYGRADKAQVQEMVKRLLNLRQIPEPHDASDALAAAICHASYGQTGVPRRRRRWSASDLKRSARNFQVSG